MVGLVERKQTVELTQLNIIQKEANGQKSRLSCGVINHSLKLIFTRSFPSLFAFQNPFHVLLFAFGHGFGQTEYPIAEQIYVHHIKTTNLISNQITEN